MSMKHIISYTCKKDELDLVINLITLLQKENIYTNKPINIVILQGQVGMGKSHLVNEYCKQHGVTSNSPTFAFLHEYNNGIYHYDLYLKHDTHNIMRLYESLENDGIHFVEWGDEKLALELQNMGFSCTLLSISPDKEHDMRIYSFFV